MLLTSSDPFSAEPKPRGTKAREIRENTALVTDHVRHVIWGSPGIPRLWLSSSDFLHLHLHLHAFSTSISA